MERVTRLFLVVALITGVTPILLGGRGPAQTGDRSAARSATRNVSPDAPGDYGATGESRRRADIDHSDRSADLVSNTLGQGTPGAFGDVVPVPGAAVDDSLLIPLKPRSSPAELQTSFRPEASSWQKLCLLFR